MAQTGYVQGFAYVALGNFRQQKWRRPGAMVLAGRERAQGAGEGGKGVVASEFTPTVS